MYFSPDGAASDGRARRWIQTRGVTRFLRTYLGIDPEMGGNVVRVELVEDLPVDDEGFARCRFHPSSTFLPSSLSTDPFYPQAGGRCRRGDRQGDGRGLLSPCR